MDAAQKHLEDVVRGRVAAGCVGLAAGIVGRGGSRQVVAYGEAGSGQAALGAGSLFEIGSTAKLLTGTLLADMVVRGEVSLTDPVNDLLPERIRRTSLDSHSVRLVDLATHTSALPRFPTNLHPADPADPLGDYSLEGLAEFLSSYRWPRDVGAEYEYSNVGFGLLGLALATHEGTTFDELLRNRVLRPLEMPSTTPAMSLQPDRAVALPHDERGEVVPVWTGRVLAGAGGRLSSLDDMLRFAAANLRPPTDHWQRATTLARATHYVRADGVRVGLGWHVRLALDRPLWFHSGETGGSRSFIVLDPAGGRAAVVLANSAALIDDIGYHLVDNRLALRAMEKRDEIDIPADVLTRHVGTYDLGPEMTVTVTQSTAGLTAEATGIGRAPIHPDSETEFYVRPIAARMRFERDASGTTTGLVLHYRGKDIRGTKVA